MTDSDLEVNDQDDETDVGPRSEEPQDFVNLADGRGLIVRGPEAGTLLADPVPGAPTTVAIRSRDEALGGTAPLFLCQSGSKFFGREPEVLASLHAAHGAHVSLGHVVRIPRGSPDLNRGRLDVPVVSIRIADPMGYIAFSDRLVVDPALPRQAHFDNAPYLRTLHDGPATYANVLLDAQRAAGANLLLTSGRAVAAADVVGSFREIADEADALIALLRDGERLALNLTLPYEFMQNQAVFDVTLDELTELDHFDVLYVRVQRSQPTYAGGPLGDQAALERLVDLGVWAEQEGKALIHAQSGLTGWLLLS